MSPATNKALLRSFYETIDRTHAAGATEFFAPDFQGHFPGQPILDGPGFILMGAAFYTAMPDLRHHIEDMVAEGETVATRLTVTGTQTGEMMGIPSSGKPVRFSAISLVRVANGRITELWIDLDMAGMLQQIGAVPAGATA